MVTRILLAYDHPIFRNGLRSLIEEDETLHVVAEASGVDEAVAEAPARIPTSPSSTVGLAGSPASRSPGECFKTA
jgi:DNA-binding NarL/FixJ family response regulator